jgi:hypothetical protein
MKTAYNVRRASFMAIALSIVLLAGATGVANALSTDPAGAIRVTAIITAGNREINRRLKTLNTAKTKISSATRVSDTDKAMLTSEVADEIAGLTELRTKLDAETTIAGAKADAQSMVTDYRVYALIVPKLQLVRVANDQQVVEGKLTALAATLQTRIDTAKAGGKDVASLQTQLDDLNAKVASAKATSMTVQAKVMVLQPTDYNTDHTVLSGYRDQLKTARADNQTAYSDAKAIVKGLAALHT